MVKPKIRIETRKVDKLKKQDRELEKLPSLDREKKVFRKGESLLSRWTRPKKVKYDLKQLSKSRKKNIRKMKSRAGKKPKYRRSS